MDRLESKPLNKSDDIEVLVWNSTRTTKLSVTVTKEARDDYANPQGFDGSSDAKFHFALDAIVDAVDRLHKRRPHDRQLVIRTADLNGR